jgi:hypothetical protein
LLQSLESQMGFSRSTSPFQSCSGAFFSFSTSYTKTAYRCWKESPNRINLITILFHIPQTMHIMRYVLTKEEKQMAFGVEGFEHEDCRRPERIRFEGIAFVVVIILLLIAMGIVF